MASGKSAAAFNFIKRRIGRRYFFPFLLFPRAMEMKITISKHFILYYETLIAFSVMTWKFNEYSTVHENKLQVRLNVNHNYLLPKTVEHLELNLLALWIEACVSRGSEQRGQPKANQLLLRVFLRRLIIQHRSTSAPGKMVRLSVPIWCLRWYQSRLLFCQLIGVLVPKNQK